MNAQSTALPVLLRSSTRRAHLLALAATSTVWVPSATAHHHALRFGVYPYLSPLALDRLMAPVLQSLSTAVHRPMLMRTKPSIATFESALLGRSYDLAFVHPFLAVGAIDSGRYRPLVRVAAPYELDFIVKADDHARTLESLRGSTVAIPPPMSAAATLARETLFEQGVDVRLEPTQSKMSCLHKLLRGEARACAVPHFAVRQLDLHADPRVVIIHRRLLPIGLSAVAAADLPVETTQRLRVEICAWSATDEGRATLAHAGWPGFVEAVSSDYDAARDVLRRARDSTGRA